VHYYGHRQRGKNNKVFEEGEGQSVRLLRPEFHAIGNKKEEQENDKSRRGEPRQNSLNPELGKPYTLREGEKEKFRRK